jgi:hypothetical protein
VAKAAGWEEEEEEEEEAVGARPGAGTARGDPLTMKL